MSEPKSRPTPGPAPGHLRIEETDWEKAVGKALKKERPEKGWPKKKGSRKDDNRRDD